MLVPIAERQRPNVLSKMVGNDHLIGPQGILTKLIQTGKIPSIIFWGPPGVGKTTLANIVAQELATKLFILNATQNGVKDIREIVEQASHEKNPILFIDEIHRFNKGQQDNLLHIVEKGVVTLIGATTENPSFELNKALLSRCQVFVLNTLTNTELITLAERAVETDEFLKHNGVVIKETQALLALSGGDARKLLNILEIATAYIAQTNKKPVHITDSIVQEAIHTNVAVYDKNGEQHYDIISAFIKSMRGSDPQATVYWLARMIDGGEDVAFIARRMIIFAAEDIGLANPNALLIANTCFDSVNKIGYPEARIILSQCALYLATAAKSNSAYKAIEKALDTVQKNGRNLSVPLHIRNAPTQLMKDLNYGKGYQYSHNYNNNFSKQDYLPESIRDTIFYEPGNNAKEKEITKFLQERWGTP